MARATVADLVARYGETELIQLTDRTQPPSRTVDDAVAARALTDASAEVDSYLAQRWPSGTFTSPALVEAECVLARHRLHRIPTDAVQAEAERVRAWLRDLAAGKAALESGATDATPSLGAPQIDAPARQYTRDTMRWL